MKIAGSLLICIGVLMGVCFTIEFFDGPRDLWREYLVVMAIAAATFVSGIVLWRSKPTSWLW